MAADKTALRDYTIIVLLALNLGITSYAAFWKSNDALTSEDMGKSSNVTEAEALTLANQAIALYNARDTAGLYAKFDSLAKAQLTQEQLAAQLENLYPVMGTLSSPAYVGSVLAGTESGRDFYSLNYKIRLTGGPFSSGDMKLTVTRRETGLGLVGFFINGTSQNNQK